jgi:hypothetical protein
VELARYLPAHRAKAGGLRLGRLSVRTSDNREIGKLLGLVVEPQSRRVRSLIVESADSQLEVPMGPMQLDPGSRALRIVDMGGVPSTVLFSPESMPTIDEADLWVPLFHSAA